MSGRLIPFYSYDGSYIDHITLRRAERLEEMGRAKVVRHHKGHVNRAVLLRGKDDPHTTFDSWIGIPVVWHQISGAGVIVEVPPKDLPIEPSQGTHFFHNMTSAGIGYFSLVKPNDKEFIRWDLLRALPGEEVAPGVRHVRLDRPLSVRMDGHTQQGVISLA